MAQIDKIKAQIDFMKFLAGFIMTTFIGVSGWSITQAHAMSSWLLAVTVVLLLILLTLAIIILLTINRKIDELEEL
jgi:membrane protein DedA with SNARE-associated domain